MPLLLFAPQNRSSSSTQQDSEPIFIFDHAEDRIPADLNFRISSRAYHISASAQPNRTELVDLLTNKLPIKTKKVWLISLRDETTLYFDGQPISVHMGSNVAHIGLDREAIIREENLLTGLLSSRRNLNVRRLKKGSDGQKSPQQPRRLRFEEVLTEEQLVSEICFKNKIQVHCLRICVSDHGIPDPFEVDLFVEFVRNQVSAEDWVHFHCHGGKGRSAQFLTMLKALYAAKFPSISIEGDIPDVLSMEKLARNNSTGELKESAEQRCDFIEHFQEYAKNGFMKGASWNDWLIYRPLVRTGSKTDLRLM